MTEMFLRSLAVACILLFTVMAFYYIAVHRDYQSSILHRAWNLLQYGCLKALNRLRVRTGSRENQAGFRIRGKPD